MNQEARAAGRWYQRRAVERPGRMTDKNGLMLDRAMPWRSRVTPAFVRIGVFVRALGLAVGVWWLLGSFWLRNPLLLPPPNSVFDAWTNLLVSGRLWSETQVSLVRLGIGYGLAAVAGIAVGLAMGRWRPVEDMADPIMSIGRSISGIAWIPILLMWFGVGQTLAIAIIFYGAVFPFILNAQRGMSSIDARLLYAARGLGAGRLRTLLEVILPATLPYLLTGARVGLGVAWMSIIAAELLGAPNGLGFSIEYALQLDFTSQMMAWILWVGVVGFVLDVALRVIVDRSAPWAFREKV